MLTDRLQFTRAKKKEKYEIERLKWSDQRDEITERAVKKAFIIFLKP
jgi:hypothetical protein